MKQDLLARLISEDWRERHAAIEQLNQEGDEQLAREVLEIVRSSHMDLSALSGTLQALEQVGRSLTTELVALLKGPDRDLHIYVPLVLGALGDPAAVPALAAVASDPVENDNARFNAIEALGRLAPGLSDQQDREQVIETMRQVLAESNVFLCYAAIIALGQCAAPELIPDLLPMLKDAYLAEPVVTALGQLASLPDIDHDENRSEGGSTRTSAYYQAEVSGALAGWLSGEDLSSAGCQAAVSALGAISRSARDQDAVRGAFVREIGPRGIQRLIALASVQGSGSCIQDVLAESLARLLSWLLYSKDPSLPAGQVEDRSSIREALVRLVWCPEARTYIEDALSEMPLPVPDTLVEMFNSGDQEQSISAARFLVSLAGRVESELARSALADIFERGLGTGDEVIAALSAEGLGRLGPGAASPQQVEALTRLLALSSPRIRMTVIEALARLHPTGLDQRIHAWLEDPNPNFRESGLRLLNAMPVLDPSLQASHEASSAALAALVDPSPDVRRAAIELLPRFNDPQVVSAVAQALNDPDDGMRISAVRACAALPISEALPLLNRAVQDDDHWVRMHAVRGLSALVQPESLPVVAFYLRDPFPPVRIAAIEGIARYKDREVFRRYLAPLLEDENYEVRRAAQIVLEGINSPDTVT